MRVWTLPQQHCPLTAAPKNAIMAQTVPQGGDRPMYRIAICEDEPSMAQENEAMICRILEARHFQRDIDFSVSGFSKSAISFSRRMLTAA